MTPANLKRACKAAGLRVEMIGGGPRAARIPFAVVGGVRLRIDIPHALLEPYVADLLVARVRELPSHWLAWHAHLGHITQDHNDLATADQRIRAACKVLGVELEDGDE